VQKKDGEDKKEKRGLR